MRNAIAVLFVVSVWAQIFTPGPQVLSFLSDVDDSDQPYGLYLPRNLDPSKTYPLVISLHGANSNHRINLRRVFGRGNRPGESDAEATRYFPQLKDVEFIVASPYARGTMGYQGIAEKDVYDVLADVKRRFSIDEDRVYLTGLSMGGGGTLWLGLTRPDVWAALAPVCPAPPGGMEELAANALNLPVHLFHGDADPAVPVDVSRKWHKNFLALDVKAEYLEYPGVRHNSWDYAYKDAAIFDWFAKFRRDRFPERVRFTTPAYKYSSAYWVGLDGLAPGTPASIDARFTGRNTLEIKTEHLTGFTLKLEGHPQVTDGQPMRMTVDGERVRVSAKKYGELSLMREGGHWRPGRYQPPTGAKRPGAEGPMAEAVAGRHIYVYGTADSPPEEELRRRREMAQYAAEWSSPRNRLSLALAVKADKEVNEKDLVLANLVLFGARETNSVIAKFATHLPLALNAGAADYGLVFIAPVNGRYALVNSGLPWWTGAAEAKRGRFRFSPTAFPVLHTFGDFILFKGSLANVIAEGRFDERWQVPAEAAQKMQATETVVLR